MAVGEMCDAVPGQRAESRMRHALEAARDSGIRRVAIFGAGAHTGKVIRALLESPVAIAGFVDDSAERQAAGICGWPVVSSSRVDQLKADALIINSDYHEPALWEQRAAFEAKGLRVVRLYPELAAGSPVSGATGVGGIEGAMSGRRTLKRDQIHAYWKSRGSTDADEVNDPSAYARPSPLTFFFGEWVRSCELPRDARILEVGCNVGRNLAYLRSLGYSCLAGVEINPHAVSAMRDFFPATAEACDIRQGALEDVLPGIPDDSFDLVYSMEVLEHIHHDSSAVFDHIARLSRRFVLTIEDETSRSPRHFPRDYGQVWRERGLVAVRELLFRGAGTEAVRLFNLDANAAARLFRKPT